MWGKKSSPEDIAGEKITSTCKWGVIDAKHRRMEKGPILDKQRDRERFKAVGIEMSKEKRELGKKE